MDVNKPSLMCSGPGGRSPSARAAATGSMRKSRQLESRRQPGGEDFTLSAEERRLIALVVAGHTNREMARHFSLSESTIYRRTVRVIGKLGAANRFELVLAAIFLRISGPA